MCGSSSGALKFTQYKLNFVHHLIIVIAHQENHSCTPHLHVGKMQLIEVVVLAEVGKLLCGRIGVRNGPIWPIAHATSISVHSFDAAFKVETQVTTVQIYTSHLGLSLAI